MKSKIIFIAIFLLLLNLPLNLFSNTLNNKAVANYLTFTPMTQTVSANSGQEISVTVLVNCYGGTSESVFFNINNCAFDNGFQSYSTNNGFILTPGQNSTITFKFKKTVTTSNSFTYKFYKNINDLCSNESNLIKITVNYIAPPTPQICTLLPPNNTSITNLSAYNATANWNNVSNNNGYKIEWIKAGSNNRESNITNINGNSFTMSVQPQSTYTYLIYTMCSDGGYSQRKSGEFTTPEAPYVPPVTPAPPCAPPVATGLNATNITNKSATISWDRIPGYEYRLQYRLENSTSWTQGSTSNLEWNKTYEYRIITDCIRGEFSSFSEIKSFKTTSDLLFPENITITITENFNRAHIIYPNGVSRSLDNRIVSTVDMLSSNILAGIDFNTNTVVTQYNNYFFNQPPYITNIWKEHELPNQTPAKDVSIGRALIYENMGHNNEVIYAVGENNKIYLAPTFTSDWIEIIPNITGPWNGIIKNIEASTYFSFFLTDTNGNCVRCNKNFGNPANPYNCRPIYTKIKGIGAAFENYLKSPPPNVKSQENSIYTIDENNQIRYTYNLSDLEMIEIPKPSTEPNTCTNCKIDGFHSTTGYPANMVYLPNSTGYFYDGSNWKFVAQDIKDIAIGFFDFFPTHANWTTSELANYSDTNMGEIINKNTFSKTKEEIKAYPNPSEKILNIDLMNFSENEIIKISFIDLSNSAIVITNETHGNKVAQFDISNLKNGIYVLKTIVAKNVYTQKIIVSH